jgi:uncharacterized phage protein gp47/JayE
MSGLTDAGLEVETLETIVDGMSDDWESAFGPSVDTSDESPDGIIIGIVGDVAAQCWEGLEQVHAAGDPDAATGAAQDALCALTGTIRTPAKKSDVDLLLAGNTGAVVGALSRAKISATGVYWETVDDATIATATAWTTAHAYSVGAVVKNGGNVYLCITAGASAGSGGPTTEDRDITDNTAHWRFVGAGDGSVLAASKSRDTGAIVADAYSIDAIDTPVSGWTGVVNPNDAVPGNDIETHSALRVRREQELGAQGSSIPDALRAELLRVPSVTAVTVFHNNEDLIDEDGIPGHAVEPMVQGGTDEDIFLRIFQSAAGGIKTHGTESGVVVDSQGSSHTIKFTRPTAVPIYVDITVEVDPRTFSASAGPTLIKEAIAAYGNALGAGRDSRARPIGSSVIERTLEDGSTSGVIGVLDATSVKISTAPTPTLETTIPISLRQIATYDTSRITVTVVEGTP